MHSQSPTSQVLAQLYDWEHDDFRDDVALYGAFARRTGGPALELACGSGRVMRALAEDGIVVVGMDCSSSMLDRARERLAQFGPKATLVEGDINRELPPGHFALIIAPLDGFGFARQQEDQVALLQRVAGALSADGLLVLDLVNAAALEGQPDGVPVLQRTGYCQEMRAQVTKWMVRRLSPANQTIELTCFYDVSSFDQALLRYEELVLLRFFSRYEVELLLAAAGLQLEAVYGDYGLGSFSDTSDRLIVVAKQARPRESRP